jgi:PAS fold
MNGRPGDEHIGRTIFDAIPELAPRLAGPWQEVLGTGEPLLDLELSGTTPATGSELRHWSGSAAFELPAAG